MQPYLAGASGHNDRHRFEHTQPTSLDASIDWPVLATPGFRGDVLLYNHSHSATVLKEEKLIVTLPQTTGFDLTSIATLKDIQITRFDSNAHSRIKLRAYHLHYLRGSSEAKPRFFPVTATEKQSGHIHLED